MKQTIKKKDFSRPGIASIKEKLGLVANKSNMVVSSADKPIEFIPMPEAFVDALKIPGIPMGVTTLISGRSNTGKSALKNALIASAQKMGILPVIYETENNFSFDYARAMGMMAEPVYGDVEVEDVDPETGEVVGVHTENRIVDYDGNFLYFDSQILADRYGDNDYSTGKKVKTKRKIAVIEDIAYSMNELLDLQDNGDIQQPILFIWDSVGSLSSWKSYTSKSSNAMWDAGALSVAFNVLTNNRIPSSKKISSPYTNTFVCVQKVWLDSMSAPGASILRNKGGESLLYSCRLQIQLGGVLSAGTKKLSATSKGENYTYGLITKVKVNKNQLDTPYNLTYEGTFCCVPTGIIPEEYLDQYKKENISLILKNLNERLEAEGKEKITESDVVFTEEDTEE
jgi:hypothetical protein